MQTLRFGSTATKSRLWEEWEHYPPTWGSFLNIPNSHFPVFFGFFGLVILDTCTPFFETDAVCVPVLMKSFFMGITSLLTYS